MADFLPAFERMIQNEGGYRLTDDPTDRGGRTYAGIAKNRCPDWAGWKDIDAGRTPASDLVRGFYRQKYWEPLRADGIDSQRIAESLFDFAVNAGTGTASKLAQIVAGTTPDGVIGSKTIAALNAIDTDLFIALFALAKIARYRDICVKDRSQMKYFLGWINRTLKEAA